MGIAAGRRTAGAGEPSVAPFASYRSDKTQQRSHGSGILGQAFR